MSAGHNPFGGGTVAVTRQGLPAATGRRRAEGREHPLTASVLLAPAVILGGARRPRMVDGLAVNPLAIRYLRRSSHLIRAGSRPSPGQWRQ